MKFTSLAPLIIAAQLVTGTTLQKPQELAKRTLCIFTLSSCPEQTYCSNHILGTCSPCTSLDCSSDSDCTKKANCAAFNCDTNTGKCTTTPEPPSCLAENQPCEDADDCCPVKDGADTYDPICTGELGTPTTNPLCRACRDPGQFCSAFSDCCKLADGSSQVCLSQSVGYNKCCVATGGPCTEDSQCCQEGDVCTAGKCAASA